MGAITTNVLCSIAASAICDVIKKCIQYYPNLSKSISSKDLEIFLEKHMEFSLPIGVDVGVFKQFLSSPQVSDLMRDYMIYKINGELTSSLRDLSPATAGSIAMPKNTVLNEDDVIEYLGDIFMHARGDKIADISKQDFEAYMRWLFSTSKLFFLQHLGDENKSMLLLIGGRLDIIRASINTLSQKIKRCLEQEYVVPVKDFEGRRKKYLKVLRQNYQTGFIYLLGEYKFNDFYIPPVLRLEAYRHSFMKNRIYLDLKSPVLEQFAISTNEIGRSNWSNIFTNSDIIYVVGGAGYGKSLFLHNIINNFSKLNINDSSNHLVIYGDLKTFVAGDGVLKRSIPDFLQQSMIDITGLDATELSKDFIQYYLDLGRCIILCDALDEVPKEHRATLHKKIVNYFKAANPNNRVCITSRDRGFIPQQDIEVFQICPLDSQDISDYLDKMIKLDKFKRDDKDKFMQQAETLIQKNFLNNFLVLSLLVNIYRAERELPENKVNLYNKCFEYIAKKREKEKSKTDFDWDRILPLMKDSTFIKLAVLVAPNNRDVARVDVENLLIELYKNKYQDTCTAEAAIQNFLEFCSSRTELFVPAATDDKFKFFHRSFFEYFYSRYIYQHSNVDEMYELMSEFDIDSEVFELTVALVKEDNEQKYQELVEFILSKAREELSNPKSEMQAFNILTLVMQVVDDIGFLRAYVDLVIKFRKQLSTNHMETMIHSLASRWLEKAFQIMPDRKAAFFSAYEKDIVFYALKVLCNFPSEYIKQIDSYAFPVSYKNSKLDTLHFYPRVNHKWEAAFYIDISLSCGELPALLEKYSSRELSDLMSLFSAYAVTKKVRSYLKKGYRVYKDLDEYGKENALKLIKTFAAIPEIMIGHTL